MAARLKGHPQWRFWKSSDSTALANGKVYFYEPGTTTPKDIYDDTDKQTTLTNPVTLTAGGFLPNPVYAEGFYDVVIKTSAEATVETISNWGDNDSVTSESSPNFVCNYSFEDDDNGDNVPDEWTFSGSNGARITSDQSHGSACVKFTGASSSSDSIDSCFIPVSDNLAYDIYSEYKTSNAGCTPKLVIKQYDKDKAATTNQTLWQPTTTSTSWVKTARFRYVPSANTCWVKISFDANTNATAYDTYIDNVWMEVVDPIPNPTFRINGLEISRDAGDTSHDLNITTGSVIASDGVYPLILESEITKQIDAAWAEGDDAGGAESGFAIPADGIIYLHLIGDSNTGLTDALVSNSATAPTLPSGWDKRAYLGGWRTNSSNNLEPGLNYGSYWWWDNAIADETLTSQSELVINDVTATAPPKSIVKIRAQFDGGASNVTEAEIFSIGPKLGGQIGKIGLEMSAATINELNIMVEVLVDSNSQYTYRLEATKSGTLATFSLLTLGWFDLKREYGV